MKYEDFEKFVREECMYETIYDDSDGRRILVIRLLDAYSMANKKKWIGLTDEEKLTIVRETDNPVDALAATEAKLKEKNSE